MTIVPTSQELQLGYRNKLAVSSCPPFIDSSIPITPVVDVAPFGTFTVAEGTVTPSGTGDFSTIFTVPQGEEWELIAAGWSRTTFVGTCTYLVLSFSISNNFINAAVLAPPIATLTHYAGYIMPILFRIPSGTQIRVLHGVSAYTSGDLVQRIIYKKYRIAN